MILLSLLAFKYIYLYNIGCSRNERRETVPNMLSLFSSLHLKHLYKKYIHFYKHKTYVPFQIFTIFMGNIHIIQ